MIPVPSNNTDPTADQPPVSFKGIRSPRIFAQKVGETKDVAADWQEQVALDQGPEEESDRVKIKAAAWGHVLFNGNLWLIYGSSMDNLWIWLVVSTKPLWKIWVCQFVNWDDDIPNDDGKITNVPNHQPGFSWLLFARVSVYRFQ